MLQIVYALEAFVAVLIRKFYFRHLFPLFFSVVPALRTPAASSFMAGGRRRQGSSRSPPFWTDVLIFFLMKVLAGKEGQRIRIKLDLE